MRNSKISVIIPFYNRISELVESINSVLAQCYKNFELILVNDGSTENIDIIENLVEQDSRIRMLTQQNQGPAVARNYGIRESTGDYIAFLDSDDLYLPNKLIEQLTFMEENELKISHTSYNIIDEAGNFINIVNSGNQSGYLYPELICHCEIATPTVMAKREIFEEYTFPIHLRSGEDVCLWIDISYKYKMGGIQTPLSSVRVSESSTAYNVEKLRIGLLNILTYVNQNPIYSDNFVEMQKLTDFLKMQYQSNFKPLVSVIIPVYNGSNYMKDAIESALNQTYKNIEIIIINDGSNDNGMTESIARSYGDKIRYINKENGGVATALNAGIENMRGEYFSWLSHDDMYDYDKISNEIEILSRLKDKTTFLIGGYKLVTKTGERLYDINLLSLYTQEEMSKPLFAVFRGGINGCATLIHKSHFERVGMFDPNLPTTQDYDMWFRILRGQKVFYYNGCYVKSRTHEEQGSRKSLSAHIAECNQLWIRMMSSLTDEERSAIDGSPFLFYLNTAKFLENNTSYDEAISYAKRQAIEYVMYSYRQKDSNNHLKAELFNTINSAIKTGLDFSDLKDILNIPYTKPRLLFLLGDLSDGGGLTKVSVKLANALTDLYDVFVIGYNQNKYLDENINIINISLNNYLVERLSAVTMLIGTDVFIMGFNCQKALLPIYSMLKKAGIKTIAWNHEFYFMPYYYSHLCHSVLIKNIEQSNADAVVWSNSFSANIYGLLHENGTVIPNPLTLDKPKKVDRQRKNVIISVGRFDDPVKNLESLLIAFKNVKNRCPDSELYVIGSYDMKQQITDIPEYTYQKLIKELDIPADSLHFTGWVNDTSVYYKNAKLQLFTSNFEGFGLVLTEAAAYGVPSIVFDGSGFEDIITDGADGYIVQRGQTDRMAERAVELICNQDKWMQMSIAAEKMSGRYSMDNISDKLHSLIDAVINKDSGELKEYLKQGRSDSWDNSYSFAQQMALHYENCIKRIMTNSSSNNENMSYSSDFYKNEYEKMLNTLSWRITKPLRLVRIAQNYCKANGFKATIKRILEKIKKK